MVDLFSNILETGFHGSILILVVLVVRLVLRKAPRNMICLLWLLAAVRLVCPISIESSLSLQPELDAGILMERDAVQENVGYLPGVENTPTNAIPADTSDWPEDVVISVGDAIGTDAPVQEPVVVDWYGIAAWVWLAGMAALGTYSITSYVNLKRRVKNCRPLEDGIYLCPGLDTAFVMGFVKPEIYLPEQLEERARHHVVAHERSHIARKDHIWKPLGFVVLTIHWFNPLVWLGYSLFCKDIEMACDQRVVRRMDTAQRKAYSLALVACAAKRSGIAACPVAFGEVGVKGRVKAVLNYKKPKFWIILIAVAAVIAVAVCFVTDPTMTEEEILDHFYAEMEELQNQENIHLLVTEKLETENPYLLDRQQEYWISGDDWYGVYTYDYTQGRYEICVAQVDGIQKCCKHSDDFEVTDNGIWQEVRESNHHHMAQLLTTDWTESTIMEIRSENGGYMVIVEGHHANESQYTTFENYYMFQMDCDGELVGVTRYDRSETIHKVFDLSGWFETATTFTYTFLEADNEAFEELIDQAFKTNVLTGNNQGNHPHDEHQDDHH